MTAAPKDISTRVPDRALAAGRWHVLPADSHARFHVRDKLVTTVHGSLPVEDGAVVVLEGGGLAQGWISCAVTGIATGNPHRDKDLAKPRFLDAAAFPSVRVEVDAPTVTRTGTGTTAGWTARAVVQARGRSAPIDLTVESPVQGEGERDGEVRIRVTGRLDRTPLGITVPSFVIGRFLDLEADLTFRRVAGDVRARS